MAPGRAADTIERIADRDGSPRWARLPKQTASAPSAEASAVSSARPRGRRREGASRTFPSPLDSLSVSSRHGSPAMCRSTYLVFGDLHGRVLPAFRLAQAWTREHGVALAGLLQVGDLGDSRF